MERNIKVFVNCPYDTEYRPLKQALMFAVISCGFDPWLVSMMKDAAKTRLEKIKEIIPQTGYGIHDISRCRASRENEWFRLNMPFEMGLDFGNRFFSNENAGRKSFVLAAERYSLQPSFSDFAGNDPKYHENDYRKLITEIRHFFYSEIPDDEKGTFKTVQQIIADYDRFRAKLYDQYGGDGISDMGDDEYRDCVMHFLNA